MFRFLSVKEINNGIEPVMRWNGYPVIIDDAKPSLNIFNLGAMFGEETPAYVVTDKSNINGAAFIMYEDTIHELKKMEISKFYLLPSSIHEVIIIPCERNDENDRTFTTMVREINSSLVEDRDKLSDTILYYDGKRWSEVEA